MALNRYQSQKLMVSTVPKGTGENGIGLSILLGYQNTIPVHALITTPSFHVYKAWWNMARSSKQHFDHLFIIYYITFDYKFIIIVKYI